MAKRPVTLRDIAEKVGVHTSTVSRVLNSPNDCKVSRDVALKVTKAADELGYHLNPFARSLKTNRSFTIGVLIPDLTDPLFPPIIRGIEDTLGAAGYTAILANSDNDLELERKTYETMKARKVDGFIMATAHRSDEVVESCLESGIPLVLINREVDNLSIPSVTNDSEAGMRLAVDHLYACGHRRIGHLAGPQSMSTGYSRLRGFQSAMRANGLEMREGDIACADAFTEESGLQASRSLLDPDRGLTAIVTSSDMLALGCYDALDEMGISCPDEVSVTGFNDIRFASKFSPPMTTVRIQHAQMGMEAAWLILRMIKGDAVGGVSMVLRPTLVVRESTAAPSLPRKANTNMAAATATRGN